MDKNELFQLAWYKIFDSHQTRFSKSPNLQIYYRTMLSQIKLAKRFGKVDLCILGDSNAHNLGTYENMRKFGKIGLSINLAIPGSRADHWLHFFHSENGKKVYSEIKDSKILWNIGGNHIIQKDMERLEIKLQKLFSLFSKSYNCLVPPIWSRHMHFLGPELEINQQIQICNTYIKKIWKTHAIDTYSIFLNWDKTEPFILTHKDLVHFSKIGDDIRIPIILFSLLFIP
ncbi:MAG: SGNH/GDSL hydrolase family protein [Leptospiraceae bacterium]|nr:SGNH/GDSL hydrolase family protein [Leptospiraceae bacterium]MCP5501636.1 SGNH/GDSL hydrolase family protein [Leptospiraceae bacterium]